MPDGHGRKHAVRCGQGPGVARVQVSGQFVDQIGLLCGLMREPGDQRSDITIGDVPEERKDLVSNPVAPETRVEIGGVVDHRDGQLPTQSDSLASA